MSPGPRVFNGVTGRSVVVFDGVWWCYGWKLKITKGKTSGYHVITCMSNIHSNALLDCEKHPPQAHILLVKYNEIFDVTLIMGIEAELGIPANDQFPVEDSHIN
jgi:hypothetical protein